LLTVKAFASATKPGVGSTNNEETNKRQHEELLDRLKQSSEYHYQSAHKSHRKRKISRHSRHNGDSSETSSSYDYSPRSHRRRRSKFRKRFEDDETGYSYHQDFHSSYPRTSHVNYQTRHIPHAATMSDRHHDTRFSQAFSTFDHAATMSIYDQHHLPQIPPRYPQQPIVNYHANPLANSFAASNPDLARQYVATIQTEQESPSRNASLSQHSHTIEEEDN